MGGAKVKVLGLGIMRQIWREGVEPRKKEKKLRVKSMSLVRRVWRHEERGQHLKTSDL